jgi:hypothetical protein
VSYTSARALSSCFGNSFWVCMVQHTLPQNKELVLRKVFTSRRSGRFTAAGFKLQPLFGTFLLFLFFSGLRLQPRQIITPGIRAAAPHKKDIFVSIHQTPAEKHPHLAANNTIARVAAKK